jgi:hypothetical protein
LPPGAKLVTEFFVEEGAFDAARDIEHILGSYQNGGIAHNLGK